MTLAHEKPRVVEHPLIAHLLAEARQRDTSHTRFRQLLDHLGVLLAYEATADLESHEVTIQTPLEPVRARRLKRPIAIVPILRAGLGMVRSMADLLPDAAVGHVGMFRDEQKLVPVSYYQKLPADAAHSHVLLVDPMLATGRSAVAAVSLLRDSGCRDIRMVCLVAAPEGLKEMAIRHPDVPIYTAAVDRQLNDQGFILPGLGDAGDRLFGT